MSLEPVPDQTGSALPDPAVAGDVVRDGDMDGLRGRIDAERAELGRTVEELAARLDWKAQVRRRVSQTAQGAGTTVSRLWRKLRRST